MEDVGTFMLLQVELYLKVVPLDWIIFSVILGYLTDEDNEIHMFSILPIVQLLKSTDYETSAFIFVLNKMFVHKYCVGCKPERRYVYREEKILPTFCGTSK